MNWDGDAYQAQFDRLAAGGQDVHGEATFVASLHPTPTSVLDAGCGTGRVATELAHRGMTVVGVDVDRSMLDRARQAAPDIEWVEHDLTALDLGRTFSVVVMAGNVPLFTPPGTHAALVAGCARHVAPAGHWLRASSWAGATGSTLRRTLPRGRARARRSVRDVGP